MPRFLFGPVTPAWATNHLPRACTTGDCVPFGPDDSWTTLRERLPAEWQPDFVVLHLAYRRVHSSWWDVPVPLVALAEDWNLLWHYYRRVLPACELVLTDTAGVEALHRAGLPHAQAANLFGLPASFFKAQPHSDARDLDILFVGNLHPAVQRERLAWLGRLAALGERWRVAIRANVFGDDYRTLLARARVVFNRSIRGECNRRTFEATAAGALLFQEEGNREVPQYFRAGAEYVAYRDDNLETLLEHYLTHENERATVAAAGSQRAQGYSFETLWEAALGNWVTLRPVLAERRGRRLALAPIDTLLARTEQALNGSQGPDATLGAALTQALSATPRDARLLNALGVWAGARSGVVTAPLAEQAARHLREAVSAEPNNPCVALNLVEALVGTNQTPLALEGARRTLALLARTEQWTPEQLDRPHFPPAFDLFRVEWERAAWGNAGKPDREVRDKLALLRWRLHSLLATATGELLHYHEAALARPDLPATRAALGCALGRAQHPEAAVVHLRHALAGNPFDAPAARALCQALQDSAAPTAGETLARQRRLLVQAAPQVLGMESWFTAAEAAPQPMLPTTKACRLVWEGPLRALHSLGLVNRELCQGLLQRGHELSLLPVDHGLPPHEVMVLPESLSARLDRPLAQPAEVHVRVQWPPQATLPPAGHWVILQPWEYGSVPRAWLEFMTSQVEELWVPSRFVRDCFLQSGLPGERLQIVPLGIDPTRFHPGVPARPLRTRKRYKFLFVGGTLARKGIDLLLAAYTRTFTNTDDVCLVIKDMGIGTFYRGQTAGDHIARCQAAPQAPEIEYLTEPLPEADLPGLYTACDCLVQPYRGEGFGLPLLEAMACGLPVVVTGYGPALDFCDDRSAYLLPSRLVRFSQRRVGTLETVAYPWLAEPDVGVLAQQLRHVWEHPDEARAKGAVGRERAHAQFTWERAVSVVAERLQVLRERPVRRPGPATPAGVVLTPAALAGTHRIEAGMVTVNGLLAADATPPPLRVSLCLIVKNEEHNLPACLESVADLVQEIIVVDTGSTDRTKQVAARFGARIVDFPWIDSFSAARNESLRHATGDWIFWMDADDRLDQENRTKLQALLAGLTRENAAYSLKCLCLPDAATGTATEVDHIRLFRNDPALRWEHRIHEQILPALRRLGAEVRWADVVVHHAGYQDPALRKQKLARDLRLLERERAELGDHPFTLFNLGSVYQELGRHGEALTVLRRSLERSHPSDSIVRKLYALLVSCHRAQGQLAEALDACQEGRRVYPDDAELLFGEALLRRDRQDLDGAVACLRQLLELKPGTHFASVDTGLRSYKARQNLGVLYRQQGKFAEAEAEWRRVVAERPEFPAAWLALGELYLEQQRWPELEAATGQLASRPSGQLEAAVLNARAELARHEFAAARQRLETVIAAHPQALWPRVILSHVLLQENRDLGAAEQALRAILELAPNHVEARNNLSVLLRERKRQAADAAFASGPVVSEP